jgi:hypothetical protein
MDLGLEHACFDGWIVLRQFCSLLCPDSEYTYSSQFARFGQGKWSGDGEVSLLYHLFCESRMLFHHSHKIGRVRIPVVTAFHQDQSVLLHCRRLNCSVNGARVDEPRTMHLGGKSACFDGGIAVSPLLGLRRRVCLQHNNSPKRRVIYKRPRNYKFVFGGHLTDVGHVFFLQFFAGFLTQLRSVGRAKQQNEEVLFGIRLRLDLRHNRGCKGDHAQQKDSAARNSSHDLYFTVTSIRCTAIVPKKYMQFFCVQATLPE